MKKIIIRFVIIELVMIAIIKMFGGESRTAFSYERPGVESGISESNTTAVKVTHWEYINGNWTKIYSGYDMDGVEGI